MQKRGEDEMWVDSSNQPASSMTLVYDQSDELSVEGQALTRYSSINYALERNERDQDLRRIISDFEDFEREDSSSSIKFRRASSLSSSDHSNACTDMCEVCIIDFPTNELYGADLPCEKACDCSIKMCLRWY